jgi:hypothetical protein
MIPSLFKFGNGRKQRTNYFEKNVRTLSLNLKMKLISKNNLNEGIRITMNLNYDLLSTDWILAIWINKILHMDFTKKKDR